MRIKTKISRLAKVILLSFAVFISIIGWSYQRITQTLQENQYAYNILQSVSNLSYSVNYTFKNNVLDSDQLQKWEDEQLIFKKHLNNPLRTSDAMQQGIDEIKKRNQSILSLYEHLIENTQENTLFRQQFSVHLIDKLIVQTEIIKEDVYRLLKDSHNYIGKVIVIEFFVILMVFFIITLILFFFYRNVSKQINKQLEILLSGTEHVKKGDFNKLLEGFEQDEFGDVAEGFNSMFKHLDKITITRDELKEEVAKRTLKLELASKIIASTNQAIVMTDLEPKILEVNPAYCNLLGYSEDDLIGKNPGIMNSSRHTKKFYSTMWNDLLHDGHWTGEVWDRKKSGELLPVLLKLSTIYDGNGNPINYIGTLTDIESIKKLEQELEQLAYFDPLTSLPNRTLMQDRMYQDILLAKRSKEKLAVIFLDLDHFKKVNDSLGHDAGDQLLEIIAERLKSSVRENDTVSRQGGDEFVILLNNIHSLDNVTSIASKIVKSVSLAVTLDGGDVFVGASIGISLYPDDSEDTETLLKYADDAMYQAKEDGRGQFKYYSKLHDKV